MNELLPLNDKKIDFLKLNLDRFIKEKILFNKLRIMTWRGNEILLKNILNLENHSLITFVEYKFYSKTDYDKLHLIELLNNDYILDLRHYQHTKLNLITKKGKKFNTILLLRKSENNKDMIEVIISLNNFNVFKDYRVLINSNNNKEKTINYNKKKYINN